MNRWVDRIAKLSTRPVHVVGLLSGTSADALDAAVCRIWNETDAGGNGRDIRAVLLSHTQHEHDPELRSRVGHLSSFTLRELAELNCRLGRRFGSACLAATEAAGVGITDIDLVGCHGQTVYHHSQIPGSMPCTLQIGDGDEVAEVTGLPVISDFRARDIAAGGEGAPITPVADLTLYRPAGQYGRRGVLNLGGIANLTVLDSDPHNVLGFDVGPANSLLDRLTWRLSGGRLPYDAGGRLASQGTVNEALLGSWLACDGFVWRKPPKSSGFEMYGDECVEWMAREHGRIDVDLLATAAEFTARAVAVALDHHVPDGMTVGEVIVTGGGALNDDLLRRIGRAVAPRVVTQSEVLGVPPLAREAMAFAILAYRTVAGYPSTWPGLTGVRHPIVLGKLSLPRCDQAGDR